VSRTAVAALLLAGCAAASAVQVSDPSQSTDTGLEVASLAIQAGEFVIAHILSHEESKEERLAVLLPDGGILVLLVVGASGTPPPPLPPPDAGR
jgi:hypothetical protein